MAYKEKNFQAEFGKKRKGHPVKGVFELKLSKGISIRFKTVADHQTKDLLLAETKEGLYIRINDSPWVAGGNKFMTKKSFDCLHICNEDAYVVVMFYTLRIKKNVYYVRIQEWLKAEKKATKKSIREDAIAEIAFFEESYLKRKSK